jgi:phosphatidylinositol glycan class T
MTYTPPVLHARPTTFQSILTIPPNSTIHLTIDVTKSFLRYTEHPPDAQRGWDLPPAVLVPLTAEENVTTPPVYFPRIYTSVLLADLATPDFSMPYNVIILSCSLMAFIFGTVFNLLTRKFVIVCLDSNKGDNG